MWTESYPQHPSFDASEKIHFVDGCVNRPQLVCRVLSQWFQQGEISDVKAVVCLPSFRKNDLPGNAADQLTGQANLKIVYLSFVI
jgi:hypothetical protein